MDPKTIVDKPTSKPPQDVLNDFAALSGSSFTSTSPPGNLTEGSMLNFMNNDFSGEGLELQAAALPQFTPNPKFLNNVTNPLAKAFAQTVHGFWTQLARDTNKTALCDGVKCASTLIPLNHTFVVPGGRFREQCELISLGSTWCRIDARITDYWDSYWIVEGLLESELFQTANATLQNFMDEIESFGFIPNGGRIYYLDRSQPPLFIKVRICPC
jgi:alpha,alpha-trehalase